MDNILKCGMCGADAGDDPHHATIDENGHVHICDGCFYPEHYDLGVLWRERERMLAKLILSEDRLHEVSMYWTAMKKQHDDMLEALKYWLPPELPFPNQPNDAICQAHNKRWNDARELIAESKGIES